MPIRPELRHHYTGAAWRETRARILTRAKSRCEQCGKPNGWRVWVYSAADDQYWSKRLVPFMEQRWTYCSLGGGGNFMLGSRQAKEARERGRLRLVLVVLTVAHLNHVPGDDRDENLKALCQWCHLNYDKLHHAETRSTRKDAARPLLVEARP